MQQSTDVEVKQLDNKDNGSLQDNNDDASVKDNVDMKDLSTNEEIQQIYPSPAVFGRQPIVMSIAKVEQTIKTIIWIMQQSEEAQEKSAIRIEKLLRMQRWTRNPAKVKEQIQKEKEKIKEAEMVRQNWEQMKEWNETWLQTNIDDMS